MQLSGNEIFFNYQNGSPILKNINITIHQGEIVGLKGPSGYGKTTLAKILASIEKPVSGKVMLNDGRHNFFDVKKRYNPVQMIFQHPEKAVNPLWKMNKIVSESGDLNMEYMEKLGIESDWLNRWPGELSSGELQRFCILRVLNQKTKFLIADEITTMLDAITQAQIWNVVIDFARVNNKGILLISHDHELINRICDRVLDIRELNGDHC